MTRTDGYYHVRISNGWNVAEWANNLWRFTGMDLEMCEAFQSRILEIGNKIRHPNLKYNKSKKAVNDTLNKLR